MTRSQKDLIGSIVTKHWDKLVQLAYRKTGDTELSKDLVQEVILTACVKIETLEKHPLPLAWCYSTLNNLIMRAYEAAYRTNEIITDEIYPEIPSVDELTLEDFDEGCVLLDDYTPQISQTVIPRADLQEVYIDMMSDILPFARTALLNGTGITAIRVGSEDE